MTPSSLNVELFLNTGVVMSAGPGRLLVGIGPLSWHNQPNFWGILQASPDFYFPDFFLADEKPWCSCPTTHLLSTEELIDLLEKGFQRRLPDLYWENPYQHIFYETFLELQSLFAANKLQKAVPYAFDLSPQEMKPELLRGFLINALRYSQCYPVSLYGCWSAKEGILGAIPETLFSLQGQHLQTMACAGTAAPSIHTTDFLTDPKERHEHAVVVSALLDTLRPYGTLHCGECHVLPLLGLSHLVTPIHVELATVLDFASCVRALHPTPALGTFPKDAEGARWLARYAAAVPRKRFGAPVGYVHGDRAQCHVAIRNMQWEKGQIFVGAGCGVVPQSQREREWAEIRRKLEAIKTSLIMR